MRDERIQQQRQKGLQESLRELEDLMAECVVYPAWSIEY